MSPTTISTLVSLIILLCVYRGDGYGSGAPLETCVHGNVIHRTKASNRTELYPPLPAATNPFVFHADVEKYSPRKSLRVTISGRNGETFNGFFLQARALEGSTPLGTFSDLPALTQVRQCSGAMDDSVTHTSRDDKEALSFLWNAPAKCAGDIIFIGSVALSHSTFYINMTSSIIEGDCTGGAGIMQFNLFSLAIGLIVALVSSRH